YEPNQSPMVAPYHITAGLPPLAPASIFGSLGQSRIEIAVLAAVMLGGSDDFHEKLIPLYSAPCSKNGEIRPTTLQYDLKMGSLSVTLVYLRMLDIGKQPLALS